MDSVQKKLGIKNYNLYLHNFFKKILKFQVASHLHEEIRKIMLIFLTFRTKKSLKGDSNPNNKYVISERAL